MLTTLRYTTFDRDCHELFPEEWKPQNPNHTTLESWRSRAKLHSTVCEFYCTIWWRGLRLLNKE